MSGIRAFLQIYPVFRKDQMSVDLRRSCLDLRRTCFVTVLLDRNLRSTRLPSSSAGTFRSWTTNPWFVLEMLRPPICPIIDNPGEPGLRKFVVYNNKT